jgi:haloalkane dehalogenase
MSWWPAFLGSLRLGSKRLTTDKIRRVHQHLTPGMKRMMLRLYRAADPHEFEHWEPRMLEATARIPTLVLWGEHDPYIPAWVAERFGTRNVKRFAESGHWAPAEVPERVSDELLRFLAA